VQPFNALNSHFLNLGSEVQVLSGTPIKSEAYIKFVTTGPGTFNLGVCTRVATRYDDSGIAAKSLRSIGQSRMSDPMAPIAAVLPKFRGRLPRCGPSGHRRDNAIGGLRAGRESVSGEPQESPTRPTRAQSSNPHRSRPTKTAPLLPAVSSLGGNQRLRRAIMDENGGGGAGRFVGAFGRAIVLRLTNLRWLATPIGSPARAA
jgi:hypothetical protein